MQQMQLFALSAVRKRRKSSLGAADGTGRGNEDALKWGEEYRWDRAGARLAGTLSKPVARSGTRGPRLGRGKRGNDTGREEESGLPRRVSIAGNSFGRVCPSSTCLLPAGRLGAGIFSPEISKACSTEGKVGQDYLPELIRCLWRDESKLLVSHQERPLFCTWGGPLQVGENNTHMLRTISVCQLCSCIRHFFLLLFFFF